MKDLSKKSQKRIAIQFYGYLRSYKDCRDSFFKHLVEPIQKAGYKVDIFMHSWDFVEGQVTSWDYEKAKTNAKPPQKTPPKDELTKLYNLKGIAITAQPAHKDSEKFIKMRWENYRFGSILGAYYSQYIVNILRQQYEQEIGIKYDLVLVTRPDLFFITNFNLEWIGKNLENKIFCYYWLVEGVFVWLDQFYLAQPNTINAMTKIYETLDYDNLCKENFCDPEDATQHFLINKKIEVLCLGNKRPFEILRSKDYLAFRKVVELQENAIIVITNKEFDRLKRLEHLGGFVRYYTNKKLAILRKNTRAIRYPIKRIFGFKTDKN